MSKYAENYYEKTIEPEIELPKGFYYDIQTKDPATRISLHPNTTITGYTTDIFDNDSNSSNPIYNTGKANMIPIWEDFSDKKKYYPLVSTRRFGKDRSTPEIIKWFHPESEENFPDVFKADGSSGRWLVEGIGQYTPKNYPYAKEAICSAILNEDFRVSITNNFSKLGGDPLGDIINSAKSAFPFMEQVSAFLKKLSEKTSETSENWKKEGKETTRIDTLGKYLNLASNWAGMSKAIMNRAIVFQGARFSYYGGTGVAFDNVALNYTLFPYWDTEDLDSNGIPKFKTIYDQLEVILPYVIGDFVPLVFAEVVKEKGDSKAISFLKTLDATAKGIASSFGSWQLPPAGFEAAVKDIDVVQRGTLKLKIGSLYSIDNIVITSCNFTLSKHLIKHPQMVHLENDIEDASQYLTPAFCDVQLGLKPVSMPSKNSLLRFMRGEGTVSDKRDVYERHMNRLAYLEDKAKFSLEKEELPANVTSERLGELELTGGDALRQNLSVNDPVKIADLNISGVTSVNTP